MLEIGLCSEGVKAGGETQDLAWVGNTSGSEKSPQSVWALHRNRWCQDGRCEKLNELAANSEGEGLVSKASGRNERRGRFLALPEPMRTLRGRVRGRLMALQAVQGRWRKK